MNGGFMKDSKEESGNKSKRSRTEMKEKHLHLIREMVKTLTADLLTGDEGTMKKMGSTA